MSTSLLLLLHGLGGDASTWGIFPQLLRADAEIVARYDIPEPYVYTTNALGRGPGIAELARELATFLRLPAQAAYTTITVLAHSMGGLIAKRLIADALIAREPLRIPRVMTFASPHLGSGIASTTSWAPATGPQHDDLAIGSQFMNALGRDWAAVGADRIVNVRHVIAGSDGTVAEWSGTAGYRTASYDVVGGENHRSIVKPANDKARAFQLARDFLLENRPTWHRAPDARHYEQPILDATLLMDSSFARSNSARFVFRSWTLPLFGREREWAELGQFLTSTDPFRWMAMSGSGGVGKSRLALELCIAASDNWFAGFLPDSECGRDWDRWQPLAPTLMVLDYATRNTDRVRGLLHALARRTMLGATYPLTNPVRVLMIIRPGDERSLSDDVVRQGDAVSAVYATGRREILALQSISDTWPIFETVFTQHRKSLPDKKVTLDALKRIDNQQRPLFAYFLADAMVHSADGSPDPRDFDAARLVEDVIERWRSQFWRPAYAAANVGKGGAEEVLLAVATICGGVPIREGRLPITQNPGLFPIWDTYVHPRLFEVMTGRDVAETVPPLEPDIVGEHFALSKLGERTPDQRTELIDLAWEIAPLGMAQFIVRAHNDAPQSDVLQLLRKPPAAREAARYWLRTAVGLLVDVSWHNGQSVRNLVEATVSRLSDLPFGSVAIFLVGPRPLTPAQRVS